MTKAFMDRRTIDAMSPFTAHQSGVAACILDAMSNKEIARAMGNSEAVTEENVSRLMRKMQARNRVDLALKLNALT
jgi:DNA-binding NarL/FixJ family response regulator